MWAIGGPRTAAMPSMVTLLWVIGRQHHVHSPRLAFSPLSLSCTGGLLFRSPSYFLFLCFSILNCSLVIRRSAGVAHPRSPLRAFPSSEFFHLCACPLPVPFSAPLPLRPLLLIEEGPRLKGVGRQPCDPRSVLPHSVPPEDLEPKSLIVP